MKILTIKSTVATISQYLTLKYKKKKSKYIKKMGRCHVAVQSEDGPHAATFSQFSLIFSLISSVQRKK